MQKVYRNTSILIILIMIGIQWGFYESYTSEFPNFKDKTPTIHIHGIFLMMWMVLLIVQPLLINTGRTQLHRTIGKVSWVLGPLIIVSMFMVGRGSYGDHKSMNRAFGGEGGGDQERRARHVDQTADRCGRRRGPSKSCRSQFTVQQGEEIAACSD